MKISENVEIYRVPGTGQCLIVVTCKISDVKICKDVKKFSGRMSNNFSGPQVFQNFLFPSQKQKLYNSAPAAFIDKWI